MAAPVAGVPGDPVPLAGEEVPDAEEADGELAPPEEGPDVLEALIGLDGEEGLVDPRPAEPPEPPGPALAAGGAGPVTSVGWVLPASLAGSARPGNGADGCCGLGARLWFTAVANGALEAELGIEDGSTRVLTGGGGVSVPVGRWGSCFSRRLFRAFGGAVQRLNAVTAVWWLLTTATFASYAAWTTSSIACLRSASVVKGTLLMMSIAAFAASTIPMISLFADSTIPAALACQVIAETRSVCNESMLEIRLDIAPFPASAAAPVHNCSSKIADLCVIHPVRIVWSC
ncbi:Uncharacterised protein [Mycolicibacterium aurum]|uniref:Uncharacterized protein n=1 Tax=Mycolicibacterium aurum TaxID=1791 RepID=A0A3S4RX78_MYCAU|nr:Uncharacterised protein [Mycolicibacterium aurum]